MHSERSFPSLSVLFVFQSLSVHSVSRQDVLEVVIRSREKAMVKFVLCLKKHQIAYSILT